MKIYSIRFLSILVLLVTMLGFKESLLHGTYEKTGFYYFFTSLVISSYLLDHKYKRIALTEPKKDHENIWRTIATLSTIVLVPTILFFSIGLFSEENKVHWLSAKGEIVTVDNTSCKITAAYGASDGKDTIFEVTKSNIAEGGTCDHYALGDEVKIYYPEAAYSEGLIYDLEEEFTEGDRIGFGIVDLGLILIALSFWLLSLGLARVNLKKYT